MRAPSNAGPAAVEQLTSRSLLPMTSSPFVPMSIASDALVGLVHPGGEDHADRVGADEPGDVRQGVDHAVRMDAQARRRGRGR